MGCRSKSNGKPKCKCKRKSNSESKEEKPLRVARPASQRQLEPKSTGSLAAWLSSPRRLAAEAPDSNFPPPSSSCAGRSLTRPRALISKTASPGQSPPAPPVTSLQSRAHFERTGQANSDIHWPNRVQRAPKRARGAGATELPALRLHN